eukprot:g2390.t1
MRRILNNLMEEQARSNDSNLNAYVTDVLSGTNANPGGCGSDLSSWDISNVTSLNETFSGFADASQQTWATEIQQWNTERVTSMYRTFHNTQHALGTNLDLEAWDTSTVTTLEEAFYGASGFDCAASVGGGGGGGLGWDVSQVTSLRGTFRGAETQNCASLAHWDVGNVRDMSETFYENHAFNLDLNAWNVSRVSSLAKAFYDARDFTGNGLSSWDVGSVTTLEETFNSVAGLVNFNVDLANWDVRRVQSLEKTFHLCSAFASELSEWDVSAATTLHATFNSNAAFNADLSQWNTSKITSIRTAFEDIRSEGAANLDISAWNVHNVEDMAYAFAGLTAFDGNLSMWNVSKVRDMAGTFYHCESFNADLSRWDVGNLELASEAFRGASQFNADIVEWDVGEATDLTYMFYDAASFDRDLSSWDVSSVDQHMLSEMFGSSSDNTDPISNTCYHHSIWHSFTSQNQDAAHNSLPSDWASACNCSASCDAYASDQTCCLNNEGDHCAWDPTNSRCVNQTSTPQICAGVTHEGVSDLIVKMLLEEGDVGSGVVSMDVFGFSLSSEDGMGAGSGVSDCSAAAGALESNSSCSIHCRADEGFVAKTTVVECASRTFANKTWVDEGTLEFRDDAVSDPFCPCAADGVAECASYVSEACCDNPNTTRTRCGWDASNGTCESCPLDIVTSSSDPFVSASACASQSSRACCMKSAFMCTWNGTHCDAAHAPLCETPLCVESCVVNFPNVLDFVSDETGAVPLGDSRNELYASNEIPSALSSHAYFGDANDPESWEFRAHARSFCDYSMMNSTFGFNDDGGGGGRFVFQTSYGYNNIAIRDQMDYLDSSVDVLSYCGLRSRYEFRSVTMTSVRCAEEYSTHVTGRRFDCGVDPPDGFGGFMSLASACDGDRILRDSSSSSSEEESVVSYWNISDPDVGCTSLEECQDACNVWCEIQADNSSESSCCTFADPRTEDAETETLGPCQLWAGEPRHVYVNESLELNTRYSASSCVENSTWIDPRCNRPCELRPVECCSTDKDKYPEDPNCVYDVEDASCRILCDHNRPYECSAQLTPFCCEMNSTQYRPYCAWIEEDAACSRQTCGEGETNRVTLDRVKSLSASRLGETIRLDEYPEPSLTIYASRYDSRTATRVKNPSNIDKTNASTFVRSIYDLTDPSSSSLEDPSSLAYVCERTYTHIRWDTQGSGWVDRDGFTDSVCLDTGLASKYNWASRMVLVFYTQEDNQEWVFDFYVDAGLGAVLLLDGVIVKDCEGLDLRKNRNACMRDLNVTLLEKGRHELEVVMAETCCGHEGYVRYKTSSADPEYLSDLYVSDFDASYQSVLGQIAGYNETENALRSNVSFDDFFADKEGWRGRGYLIEDGADCVENGRLDMGTSCKYYCDASSGFLSETRELQCIHNDSSTTTAHRAYLSLHDGSSSSDHEACGCDPGADRCETYASSRCCAAENASLTGGKRCAWIPRSASSDVVAYESFCREGGSSSSTTTTALEFFNRSTVVSASNFGAFETTTLNETSALGLLLPDDADAADFRCVAKPSEWYTEDPYANLTLFKTSIRDVDLRRDQSVHVKAWIYGDQEASLSSVSVSYGSGDSETSYVNDANSILTCSIVAMQWTFERQGICCGFAWKGTEAFLYQISFDVIGDAPSDPAHFRTLDPLGLNLTIKIGNLATDAFSANVRQDSSSQVFSISPEWNMYEIVQDAKEEDVRCRVYDRTDVELVVGRYRGGGPREQQEHPRRTGTGASNTTDVFLSSVNYTYNASSSAEFFRYSGALAGALQGTLEQPVINRTIRPNPVVRVFEIVRNGYVVQYDTDDDKDVYENTSIWANENTSASDGYVSLVADATAFAMDFPDHEFMFRGATSLEGLTDTMNPNIGVATVGNGAVLVEDEGVVLDGVDDYLQITTWEFGNEDMTAEAYVKVGQHDASYSRIFDFGSGAYQNNVVLCGRMCTTGGGTVRFDPLFQIMNKFEALVEVGTSCQDELPFDTWVHLVSRLSRYRANQTSGEMKIRMDVFVDGVLAQTNLNAIYPARDNRVAHYVGRSWWTDPSTGAPNPDPYFNGTIAYLRFWNGRALLDENIHDLYTNRESRHYFPIAKRKEVNFPKPDHEFMFRGAPSLSALKDTMNSSYEVLEIGNNAHLLDDGGGLYMNGAGDYVAITPWSFGNVEFTLECYLEFHDESDASSLLDFASEEGGNVMIGNAMASEIGGGDDSGTGNFKFEALDVNASEPQMAGYVSDAIDFFENDKWVHVVVLMKRRSPPEAETVDLFVYKNGTLAATVAKQAFPPFMVRDAHFLGRSYHEIQTTTTPSSPTSRMGSVTTNAPLYFGGTIAFVRMWNDVALTEDQIANLYAHRELDPSNSSWNLWTNDLSSDAHTTSLSPTFPSVLYVPPCETDFEIRTNINFDGEEVGDGLALALSKFPDFPYEDHVGVVCTPDEEESRVVMFTQTMYDEKTDERDAQAVFGSASYWGDTPELIDKGGQIILKRVNGVLKLYIGNATDGTIDATREIEFNVGDTFSWSSSDPLYMRWTALGGANVTVYDWWIVSSNAAYDGTPLSTDPGFAVSPFFLSSFEVRTETTEGSCITCDNLATPALCETYGQGECLWLEYLSEINEHGSKCRRKGDTCQGAVNCAAENKLYFDQPHILSNNSSGASSSSSGIANGRNDASCFGRRLCAGDEDGAADKSCDVTYCCREKDYCDYLTEVNCTGLAKTLACAHRCNSTKDWCEDVVPRRKSPTDYSVEAAVCPGEK